LRLKFFRKMLCNIFCEQCRMDVLGFFLTLALTGAMYILFVFIAFSTNYLILKCTFLASRTYTFAVLLYLQTWQVWWWCKSELCFDFSKSFFYVQREVIQITGVKMPALKFFLLLFLYTKPAYLAHYVGYLDFTLYFLTNWSVVSYLNFILL